MNTAKEKHDRYVALVAQGDEEGARVALAEWFADETPPTQDTAIGRIRILLDDVRTKRVSTKYVREKIQIELSKRERTSLLDGAAQRLALLTDEPTGFEGVRDSLIKFVDRVMSMVQRVDDEEERDPSSTNLLRIIKGIRGNVKTLLPQALRTTDKELEVMEKKLEGKEKLNPKNRLPKGPENRFPL